MKKLLLFSLFLCITGCTHRNADEDAQTQASSPVVSVKTTVITKGDVTVGINATGKTDAVRKEKLSAPVAGKILSVKTLEGTPVKAGDVLATLLTRESQAAIAGAEALLRSAQTDREKSQARRALELARSSQNVITIRTKFTGVVATRSVSEGDIVTDNAELFTVVDLSTINFLADVPLHEVQNLHTGQQCAIHFALLPQNELKAVVDAINPQTDPASQTVKVRCRFIGIPLAVTAMLKTEMIGTARIMTGIHHNVLLVPKVAVLRNDETNIFSIVTVTGDTLARTVNVGIGASTDSTVEVMSDELREGMSVVTEGNYSLADSTKVKVVR